MFFSGIIRHDVDIEEYILLGKSPEYECVGKVFVSNDFKGSCVLVKNNFILTSAHLFKKYNESQLIDYNFVFGNKSVHAKKVTIHPEYSMMSDGYKNDLAIIEIEGNVYDIKLPVINNRNDELNVKITGVGYGYHGLSNNPNKLASKQLKIAGENVIDSMGMVNRDSIPTILYCDFDSPDTRSYNVMGNSIPCNLEYIVASGDSGGGIFRMVNNSIELLGITKGGGINPRIMIRNNSYYGQTMEFVRVSAFYTWITNIINQ